VIVLKVFNNNVVLARDDSGREVVLTGRGLGFQAKAGMTVDADKVVQTFIPDAQTDAAQLSAFLTEIPPEHLSLAADILRQAQGTLGTSFGQAMIIPLADHLTFAIRRVRQGLVLEYPLRAEVSHLYPAELRAARDAVALARERTGVALPDDEAVPIALHFVNALFASDDLARTFQMTEVFQQVFAVLESAYQRTFDTESINAARFITHLRYFFARVHAETQLDQELGSFTSAIRLSYPDAYRCAIGVRAILELRLGQSVTEDETAYLTMHIARLTQPS